MIILTLEINQEAKEVSTHIRVIDEADKLNEYYALLDCQCIDMATICVDGHPYDVVCDDEGLFRNPLVPTLYVSEEQVLFGNLAFVKVDDEGNTIGLEPGDIARLLRYIEQQREKLHRWTARQIKKRREMEAQKAIKTNQVKGGKENG